MKSVFVNLPASIMPRLLLVVLATIVLSACESTPKIHSVFEQGADFTQYQTYAFLDELEPSGQEYTTIYGKYLRTAISAELQKRGLQEAKNPDLLVGYHIHTKEKVESQAYPSASARYYRYRGSYGYSYGMGYGTDIRVRQYTEGTLNVDVVDRERKQLVWEGVAVGRLKSKPPEDLQAKANEVVGLIFAEYPVAVP